MCKGLTLITGGVRAGKSAFAQQLAAAGNSVLFVATAEAGDNEMAARIAAHKAERPANWDTLEEPVHIVREIVRELGLVSPRYDTILLDCLTLWVSNLLLQSDRAERAVSDISGGILGDISRETERLLEVCRNSPASWIVVTNEVGLGIVPENKLGRIYIDALGQVNKMVAAEADNVHLMVAGLPLAVKGVQQQS